MPTAPSVTYAERVGTPSNLREVNQTVGAIVGTAKRGPAVSLLTSWQDHERIFGGLKDDEPGPLHAYGFFAEGGNYLLYSRIKDSDARHGSRYILDTQGRALGLGITRWETGQQDITLSFRKGASSLTTSFPLAVLIGDVFGVVLGKFNRGTGSWVTDGYAVGQKITTTGFVAPANNGTFEITAISAADITVAETLTNVASSANHKMECTGFTVGSVTEFEAGDVLVFDKSVVPVYSLTTQATTFTDNVSDVITHAGFDYPNATKVVLTNSGGALATGLSTLTYYWTIRQSATTSKLASSLANALAGTAVDITIVGTGTHTMTAEPSVNYLVVTSVEPSTGMVNVARRGLRCATVVPSGTAVYTATQHKVSTTLASTLDTAAAQAVLTSANNVKVGSVLLFLPPTATHATLPFSRVATGVSGSTVSLDAVPAAAYTAGCKVMSIEFHCTVSEAGRSVEPTYKFLSSESTNAQYFQDKLGPGISFDYGASVLATSATDIDNVTRTFVLSDTVANLGIAAGDWLRLTEGASSASGITAQVKTASGSSVTFDDFGIVPTIKSASLNVYTATPSIAASDTNKSLFIVLDSLGVYTDGDQSTEKHTLVPYPETALALTGGQYGGEPATTGDIVGVNIDGEKTGLYAFEDTDEFKQIFAVAVPGLIDSDSTSPSRQTLDALCVSWAETNGTTYITAVPSTITRAMDAKSYRLNSLAIQNSHGALYFGGGKFSDPRDTSRTLEVSGEGWQMGSMAKRARNRGTHVPPANVPFVTLFDVVNRVSDPQHALLNEAGVNVFKKNKFQGVKAMGARTLLTADGTMRHMLNCRQWLNRFRRTLMENYEGLLFEPANEYLFEPIKNPINVYLMGQLALGVFKFKSASGSFFVNVGDETTTAEDLGGGDIYVHVGVSLAGATERINFVIFGFEGEANGVREV